MNKFYITTPIFYVNAPPHLGQAFTLVQADAVARYQRLLGKEVYFLSGADEHGATNVRAAEAAGKEVKEFVDENSEKLKELIKKLGVSNDDFIRTSDQKRHWPGAQKLWKKLADAGDIYKAHYKGLYCVGHEAFITQKDLVRGKCPDHDKEPEIIEEENYFFRLSKYTQKIKEAIADNRLTIIPEGRKNEVLSLLESGLEDVSFSRPSKDISWGIPVPGDASQTMYVWADALSNYLTALGYGQDETLFNKLWPADLQIIGKDILRFHAAIWPGMLFSAGLPLPKTLLVHGFITSAGRKMSKTIGNVIDPFRLIEKYGRDALRFYLLYAISPFEDGDCTEEKFNEVYNGSLSNGLGNTVSRVAQMIKQYFNGSISRVSDKELSKAPFGKKSKSSLPDFIENFLWPEYEKAMNEFQHHRALGVIMDFLSEIDGYIQEYEPYKLIKTDKEKVKAILWCLVYSLAHVSWFLEPFMPDTAEKIREIFGVKGGAVSGWKEFNIKEAPVLFPRKEL